MSTPTGVDPSVIARSIAELHASELGASELRSALQAVVEATSTAFGADGGGVMLIDDQQALHYVGATDGRAAAMEAAQEETGEGPCVDSLLTDQIICTDDLLDDPRWPELRAQVGPLGVRAILGVPLHVGPTTVGSLNVYRFTAGTWQTSDLDAISAFGRVVEELLTAAMVARERHTIVDQLTGALASRVVIERAVGVVMASLDLDPVRAFDALRRRARARRARVADVAAEVVEARRFLAEGAHGQGASA
jgi:GAF domain-containing protein